MLVNFDVLTERLGDEVAVLNLKTNRFFLLNSTGGRLWDRRLQDLLQLLDSNPLRTGRSQCSSQNQAEQNRSSHRHP